MISNHVSGTAGNDCDDAIIDHIKYVADADGYMFCSGGSSLPGDESDASVADIIDADTMVDGQYLHFGKYGL